MTKARSNAVANAAKGDLTVGNGTDLSGILAVGSNGDTLVADSSTTTGLSYQANWAAGKNKIINGDFYINQRAFTSTTTNDLYLFDRWKGNYAGGTTTFSAETFTAGAAPVAGYEGKNYFRVVTTGQSAASDRSLISQRIEDVRTLAGQTATISFWAKAASGTPNINVVTFQNFGSGGSTGVNTVSTAKTITTAWQRYSFTIAIPSISGKTLGADNRLMPQIYVSDGGDFGTGVGAQNNTFDFWGVQVEAGSVATAFQTATGTLQGELAACQRYYWRATAGNEVPHGLGFAINTTTSVFNIQNPVPMRIAPTSVDYANVGVGLPGTGVYPITSLVIDRVTTNIALVQTAGSSGLTSNRPYVLQGVFSTTNFVGFNAEL
jgi:hypothetical protein